MTDRFIQKFTIMWSKIIEDSGMESSLKSHIHRIIDDDDGKNKTHSKFIAPDIMLESHCCRKCYHKSWVCWWHPSTSQHIGYTKFPIDCVYNPFDYHSKYECCEWYYQCVLIEICLYNIKVHKNYLASRIEYSFFPDGAVNVIVSPTLFPIIDLPSGDSLLILLSRILASCEPTIV